MSYGSTIRAIDPSDPSALNGVKPFHWSQDRNDIRNVQQRQVAMISRAAESVQKTTGMSFSESMLKIDGALNAECNFAEDSAEMSEEALECALQHIVINLSRKKVF